MPTLLDEKKGRRKVVNDAMMALFEEGTDEGGNMVYANIKSVADPKAELDRLYKEQQSLAEEITEEERKERMRAETQEAAKELAEEAMRKKRPHMTETEAEEEAEKEVRAQPAYRSLGAEWMQSEARKDFLTRGGKGTSLVHESDASIAQILQTGELLRDPKVSPAVKALFDNADFDPFEQQLAEISPMPFVGPRMFLSAIPQVPIMTDSCIYYEMTTRTEPTEYTISEGAAYTAFTYNYTRRTATVQKEGAYVPITGEAEEDGPMIVDDINRDLVMAVAREIDKVCVDVIEAHASTNKYTATGESGSAALYRGCNEVRVNGQVDPNLIVMHSTDWTNIVVEQASTGEFLFSGGATSDLMMQRWGMPVVLDNALAEGTALVLDTDAVRFRDRRSLQMYTTQRFQTVSEDSVNRTVPIDQYLHYADARFAFYVRVPKRITEVTL